LSSGNDNVTEKITANKTTLELYNKNICMNRQNA